MAKHLNIVSFDVPFPANYGGVIDVYYKLFWLKQAGVKIHLHCFKYGRYEAAELSHLCETVQYYPRKIGLISNLSVLPYTVKSRQSKDLENNLLANDYPILFEVLHTCYLLSDNRFAHRKKIYRHSNIEHEYYNELAKTERNFLKRIFLKVEAYRLKQFEKIISNAQHILAVNQKDADYFKINYPLVKTLYLPSFHAASEVHTKPGRGDYVLFHGNLSISENYEAAVWLINHVFTKLSFSVKIAGLNPPSFLKTLMKNYQHIQLIENPSDEAMQHLIENAHVHVLYTLQPTGLKLKLLNVLHYGRFAVVNSNMLSGTGLSNHTSLSTTSSPNEFIERIKYYFEHEMNQTLIEERRKHLENFSNTSNSAKLVNEIFGD